jgi:hypothetical protein
MKRIVTKWFMFTAVLVTVLVLGGCEQPNDAAAEPVRGANYTLAIIRAGDGNGYVFPAAYPDYGEVIALEVTVMNRGPGIAEETLVGLSGEGAESFVLSADTIDRIEAGASRSFTVRPKTGLNGGDYRPGSRWGHPTLSFLT